MQRLDETLHVSRKVKPKLKQALTTANHWFALPRIAAPPRGLDRLAFLMMNQRGLIELSAEPSDRPLLSADVFADGESILSNAIASTIEDWIPNFESQCDRYIVSSIWLTPVGFRGLVIRLAMQNKSDAPLATTMRHRMTWGQTCVTRYAAESIAGHIRLDPDGWGGGIALGFVTHQTQFALGVGCTDGGEMRLTGRLENQDVDQTIDPRQGAVRSFARNAVVQLDVTREINLKPGESAVLDLFFSVGVDLKSGPLHARYMSDLGFDHLFESTRKQIRQLQRDIPDALSQDDELGPLVRRNRLFCYNYSLGRTIDTEELCPVTSRSSDYYVSAGYWDRDSLLWSFPTILDMDTETAAQMLLVAFGRQGGNIGIHSRFIDGSVCEPGFELDELCAPFVALDSYLRKTGDWSILERIELDAAIRRAKSELRQRKHPEIDLFSTEYLPTDDIAVHPYCIYDNVLVWVTCGVLRRIAEHRRDISAQEWATLREKVHDAIWSYGVTVENGDKLFAWSTDLRGGFRLYDEPPGSLTLLAWYGFCSYDDPIFKATCRWIYSLKNEHYFADADEIGCLHERHPWILAVGNSLLTPDRVGAATALLSRSSMDMGFACETIDEKTGAVASGKHFATCAGFLCHGLITAYRRSEAGKVHTFSTQFADASQTTPLP